MPYSRVGWIQPITEQHFHDFPKNYYLKLPRDLPTRLFSTGVRLKRTFYYFFLPKFNSLCWIICLIFQRLSLIFVRLRVFLRLPFSWYLKLTYFGKYFQPFSGQQFSYKNFRLIQKKKLIFDHMAIHRHLLNLKYRSFDKTAKNVMSKFEIKVFPQKICSSSR